jgi:hypothetical protein
MMHMINREGLDSDRRAAPTSKDESSWNIAITVLLDPTRQLDENETLDL